LDFYCAIVSKKFISEEATNSVICSIYVPAIIPYGLTICQNDCRLISKEGKIRKEKTIRIKRNKKRYIIGKLLGEREEERKWRGQYCWSVEKISNKERKKRRGRQSWSVEKISLKVREKRRGYTSLSVEKISLEERKREPLICNLRIWTQVFKNSTLISREVHLFPVPNNLNSMLRRLYPSSAWRETHYPSTLSFPLMLLWMVIV